MNTKTNTPADQGAAAARADNQKITKDTQTVWRLHDGATVIGISGNFFVRFENSGRHYITEYTKSEMMEVFGLTNDQLKNMYNSGI